MVNDSTLKTLQFEYMETYFEYIIASRENGNHAQARQLFSELSEGMQGQRVDFFEYLGSLNLDIENWKQYL